MVGLMTCQGRLHRRVRNLLALMMCGLAGSAKVFTRRHRSLCSHFSALAPDRLARHPGSLSRRRRSLCSLPRHPRHFFLPPPVAALPSPAPPALFSRRRRSRCSLPRHPRHFFLPPPVAALPSPAPPPMCAPLICCAGRSNTPHVITRLDPVIHVAVVTKHRDGCSARSPLLGGPGSSPGRSRGGWRSANGDVTPRGTGPGRSTFGWRRACRCRD